MKINSTTDPKNSKSKMHREKIDNEFWKEIDTLFKKYNLTTKDVLQNYLSFIQRRDLPRLLAYYEMFKRIENLPGSIVELGTYKGNGLFTWSKLLETFCPGDRVKKVFSFDHFQGYSDFSKHDHSSKNFVENENYYLRSNYNIIKKLNELHNNDNILKGVKRSYIINGDICETIPKFVKDTKGLRLCLLYLDVNLYEPTKFGIDHLFPLVIPGGIIAFTGYGQHPWEGESKALDDLFNKIKYTPKIHRFNFSKIPSGYFIKE